MNQELALAGKENRYLVKNHPCFDQEAHGKCGRIHLPVSPSCNIQCKFCQRGFNKWEQRPGVSRQLLTPEEALNIVRRALVLCPEITVVGIAGPGDTLATDDALATFKLVHRAYPHLINCLSTNGLLLKDKAEAIARVGVRTVTVTVNAVDPLILKHICSHIVTEGKYLTGEAAASHLIQAQLAGIEQFSKIGGIVKVNTVLIPGVNEQNIAEIARVTAEAGANLHNIIPLIPQHDFAQHRPPGCQELNQARAASEHYLPVFRHCRQCRADACGIPGAAKDFAEQLYQEPLTTFSHG